MLCSKSERLLAFVASVVLLTCQHQQPVESDSAANVLKDVHKNIADLERSLESRVKEIFYEHRAAAQANENFALLFLIAHMAESESILYASQRRALAVLEGVIKNYFIAKSIPLPEILVNSKYLIELIVKRSIVSSIERGLLAIERYRKEIFLLNIRLDSSCLGVKETTRKYFVQIASTKRTKVAMEQEFQETIARYRDIAPLRLSDLSLSEVDTNIPETLRAIDDMLATIEIYLDGPSPSEDDIIKKYVDPKLLVDIRYSKFLSLGVFDRPPGEVVDALLMANVEQHEQKVAREAEALDNYLRQIDSRAIGSDRIFMQTLREIFYDVYPTGQIHVNYPLMALSAQMAETEALLHTSELRMLGIIKTMLKRHIGNFAQITNSKPIDMLVLRLITRAAVNGFNLVEVRRKKLYLSIRRYRSCSGVEELSFKFARLMQSRQAALVKSVSDMKELVQAYMSEVPEAYANQMLAYIDQMAEAEAAKWRFGANEDKLLKDHLEASIFDDIHNACQSSANRIHRPRGDLVTSISMDKVWQLENELISANQAQAPADIPDLNE